MSKSLDRAIRLMRTSDNYSNYVVLKIKPSEGGCCCFHCWPQTWALVNRHIAKWGALKDEGDVAIGNGKDIYVLECHESGPEIVFLAELAMKILPSVLDIILIILKGLQSENKKSVHVLKITKQRIIQKDDVRMEDITTVELPLNEKSTSLLNLKIKKALIE